MTRPAKALIDLTALHYNYALACRLAPQANTLALVKANAYGHGAVGIATALEPLAPALAVACIEEALILRQAGINKPILLLEGIFTTDEIITAIEQNFWLMVENTYQVQAIINAPIKTPVTVWLKADTGMHRLGLQETDFRRAYTQLKQSPKVEDAIVLATHFACADELHNPFTQEQITRFSTFTAGLNATHSLANSAGLLGWEDARIGWTRPGFMLYGLSPFDTPHPDTHQLQPVMQLVSAVMSVRHIQPGEHVGYGAEWTAKRPSVIATVAMGYGDGYPQQAPENTPVLVDGQRAPLVGRVSMGTLTVDITDLSDVTIGSPVELWGKNLSVNDVATYIGTSGYELLTRMPARVPRICFTA